MGLLDSIIFGTALGVSGAFDKNKKTDKAAAFGAALGASIGSGRKWTMADSMRLNASINALDSMKEDNTKDYSYSGSNSNYDYYGEDDTEVDSIGYPSTSYGSSNHEYDNFILNTSQEEELEEAGIDTFDFELMDDEEKREALEDAGLDPFDFDMY